MLPPICARSMAVENVDVSNLAFLSLFAIIGQQPKRELIFHNDVHFSPPPDYLFFI